MGSAGDVAEKIKRTDEEWRSQLTAEEYAVCRAQGTEVPFTGEYNNFKGSGNFRCTCCGALLFKGSEKFNSGTGWPSFWAPAEPSNVETHEDSSYGMVRVEVHCKLCDAHLGHLFEDGPTPTHLRYCINSVSLKLDSDEDTETP